jgi:hypothetical protein
MACVKFKPNFNLKSYFFYFVKSLFKTHSIRFSISNSILFKYYFFINFLLLFSTQLKPNKHPKKPTATSSTEPSNFSKKNPSKFTNFHRNITENHTNFYNNITENHQNQNNTSTSKQNHTQTITITDLKKKKKQQKKPKKKKKKEKREMAEVI